MLNGADLMVIRLSLKKIIVAVAVIAAAVIICVTAALNFSAVDVCIDPGHGGYDSGAEFSGRNEKDDNLAVALLVRDELEKAEIRTCITRDEDEFISLSKRCRIANRHRQSCLCRFTATARITQRALRYGYTARRPNRIRRSLRIYSMSLTEREFHSTEG